MIVADRLSINCNWIPLDTGWGVYLRRRDAVVQWSESVGRSYHGERWREWPSEKKSLRPSIVHGCVLIGNFVSNFRRIEEVDLVRWPCCVPFILVEWQLTTPSAMNLWFPLNSRSLARCRVRVRSFIGQKIVGYSVNVVPLETRLSLKRFLSRCFSTITGRINRASRSKEMCVRRSDMSIVIVARNTLGWWMIGMESKNGKKR